LAFLTTRNRPILKGQDVIPKISINAHGKRNIEGRESKSLCPKEFRQRDIERYDYLCVTTILTQLSINVNGPTIISSS
jgi:hypothetical protein